MIKKISLIINPASGRSGRIAGKIETCFKGSVLDWNIDLTEKAGDAQTLAHKALEQGRDAIGVIGGDGTLKEAAQAVKGTECALAIFPAGTGNVLANELKVEANVKKWCRSLIEGQYVERRIDVGTCNGRSFLVRVCCGYEAQLVKSTPWRLKTQIGWLAYAFGGFKALLKAGSSVYQVECDGIRQEFKGLSFVVANSTNLGITGVNFWPFSRVDDGWLDFFVIRKADIERLLASDLRRREAGLVREFFIHKKIKRVRISVEGRQEVHMDGDLIGEGSLEIGLLPGGLKLIIPRQRK